MAEQTRVTGNLLMAWAGKVSKRIVDGTPILETESENVTAGGFSRRSPAPMSRALQLGDAILALPIDHFEKLPEGKNSLVKSGSFAGDDYSPFCSGRRQLGFG